MNKDVYVIIPVYNEAAVIGDVIKKVQKTYSNVIAVNDGSRDHSAQAVLKAGATLIDHAINLGAGAATQTGVDYALADPGAKYFITIDADGQHDIDDASRMLDYLKTHPVNVVFGSRFLGIAHNMSPAKKNFLKLAAAFSTATSGTSLSDPHIGIRVFDRKFAEALKITMPGFAHASEIMHRISTGNFKYAEIPVTITYSDYSKAKGQSMFNAVNITTDLLFNRLTKK